MNGDVEKYLKTMANNVEDPIEASMTTETEKHFYRVLVAILEETNFDKKRTNRQLIHTLARSALDTYIIKTMASRPREN